MYGHEMSTILVFVMTFGQLLAVLVGILKPSPLLFNAFVAYGSPPYFIINSLGANSVAFEANPILPLFVAFHAIKYLALARSQFIMERHSLHYLAVIFEITYLIICFYYL